MKPSSVNRPASSSRSIQTTSLLRAPRRPGKRLVSFAAVQRGPRRAPGGVEYLSMKGRYSRTTTPLSASDSMNCRIRKRVDGTSLPEVRAPTLITALRPHHDSSRLSDEAQRESSREEKKRQATRALRSILQPPGDA